MKLTKKQISEKVEEWVIRGVLAKQTAFGDFRLAFLISYHRGLDESNMVYVSSKGEEVKFKSLDKVAKFAKEIGLDGFSVKFSE